MSARNHPGTIFDNSTVQKLRSDLRQIFQKLPRDSQQVLLFDPQHVFLLQGGREPHKFPGKPLFSPSGSSLGVSRSPSPRGKTHGERTLAENLGSDFPQIRLQFEDLAGENGGFGGQNNGEIESEIEEERRNSLGYKKAFALSTRELRGINPKKSKEIPTRKAQSTPNSPFGYTFSRYFSWSPKDMGESSNLGLLRGSVSVGERIEGNEEKSRESLGTALDPNPFNPLV